MAKYWIPLLFCVGLVAAHAAKTQPADSWPQFHGPNRDNISTETGLLKKWPEAGPKLAWTFSECGSGFSGVSLADGMIFTAGDFDKTENVIALNPDGKLLWKTANGSSWTGPYPGSRTTPTWNDGMLYQMNPDGRIAAYRARTGEEAWAVDLKSTFGAQAGTWAMAENLAVEGDLLFCLPGGDKASVAALDKKTGATVWANAELHETAAYCSPILVTYKDVRQLIALTQKSVIGVDVKTGKILWAHPHVTKNDQNVTQPIFWNGYVFVTSGHSGGGRLLKINDTSTGVDEIWWDENVDNCHGGVILLDGCLYGSACRSGGRGFFRADLLTGKIRYRDRKLEKVSLTCADGMLYGLTQTGKLFLMQPGKEQLEIASQCQATQESSDLAFAHPVICGGRLYIRHGTNLYAYNIRGQE